MRFFRLFALLLLLAPSWAWAAPLTLEVFDVGQGDAMLLTSPTGKRVLIDAGPPEAGERMAKRLRDRGIDALDLLVMTHPHLDHVGGVRAAIAAAPPRLVLDPGTDHPTRTYEQILDELLRRKIPLRIARRGTKIDLGGGAVAEVLAPPEPRLGGKRSVNANSIVLAIRFGQIAWLLTGDAEPETERWLLRESGSSLRADLLKVAHHGSRHSSTAEFLRAVGPRDAIVSCGAGNDYGHPAPAAIERLERAGAKIWRTDRDGSLRVTTDGKTMRVERIETQGKADDSRNHRQHRRRTRPNRAG
ncbi:ComEC/Rec2 family competence protein [Vulgatibacter incomptus]|uniref:DNA internalization-related competence protein ComEC/Rec2 n=1 Tax=Vulgatibacter incomptus TaxID=1391653 RepID=A0A0K1P9U9_9BACT|nr:ComEC/Rec2 family competence protein [Vulgatibacter incomptus]AKU90290.1 DNA internalization-related competence protein ComEC/Rec2 [Vulgatibacter incomptus]